MGIFSSFRSETRRPARAEVRHPARVAPVASESTTPFAGLSEQDVTALYKLPSTRILDPGQSLSSAEMTASLLYVVTGGVLELATAVGGTEAPITTIAKGQAVELHPGDAACPLRARARERTTVIELSRPLLATLPPATHAFAASASAATWRTIAEALTSRCAESAHAASELARCASNAVARRPQLSQLDPVMQALDGLPRLPLHTTDLMCKLLAPNASTNEIVDLIKNDPALASLVLKTVNSPYFGLRAKIADYYRAFLHLGLNAVYQLVLDDGTRRMCPDLPEAEEVQAHSYLVSVFAYEIAGLVNLHAQVSTTIGLLHDIGKIVRLTLAAAQPSLAPVLALVDPTELGTTLLRRWSVPDEVCLIIEHQHDPEMLPPEAIDAAHRRQTVTLYLAHLCAEISADPAQDTISTAYVRQHLTALGLGARDHVELRRDVLLPRIARQAGRLPRHVRALLKLDDADIEPESS